MRLSSSQLWVESRHSACVCNGSKETLASPRSRDDIFTHTALNPAMMYRLNLYHGKELPSTEFVDAPLELAKGLATAACDSGQAHRAELVSEAGSIIFQRW